MIKITRNVGRGYEATIYLAGIDPCRGSMMADHVQFHLMPKAPEMDAITEGIVRRHLVDRYGVPIRLFEVDMQFVGADLVSGVMRKGPKTYRPDSARADFEGYEDLRSKPPLSSRTYGIHNGKSKKKGGRKNPFKQQGLTDPRTPRGTARRGLRRQLERVRHQNYDEYQRQCAMAGLEPKKRVGER